MSPRRDIDPVKNQSIVKAATKLFLKNGYTKTSMDKIAQEAGVTKQTIYSHFSNKEQLFSAMVTQQCEKHTPPVDKILDPNQSFFETLANIGLGFLQMITSKEGIATTRLVMGEAQNRPHLAELFYETGPRKMNEIMINLLNTDTAKEHLKIHNVESAASYFFAMLKGRYHLRVSLNIAPQPKQQEFEQHVQETIKVFARIYDKNDPIETMDLM